MPTYYEKSLSEVVQNIINNIHDALPQADTKEGTFLRDVFINPISDEFTAMYGDMQLLKLSQSVLTAVGDDLDFLASNYFITRKAATKSSGKLRFYIKNTDKPLARLTDDDLPDGITIPMGTIVATMASYEKDEYQFQTTETATFSRDGIKTLPIDGSYGFRFIEVPAESIGVGTVYNVGAGEIVQQITNTSSNEVALNTNAIAFVLNPFAFSGGTDFESDADLAERIRLAITGSNIGTKDGYLSYILSQEPVVDAKVIGAGDSIMFRDGGYVRPDGKYQIGKGGMVDIYVRGLQNQEEDWDFPVTSDYLYGNEPFSNILLPRQPINSIVSIISQVTGQTLVNADEFEIEKATVQNPLDPNLTQVQVKYCKDILWDFSVGDSFPDTMYYPLPSDLTPEQIRKLKTDVDTELTAALEYLSNISYGLDWTNIGPRTGDGAETAMFKKMFYNNQVYKITAKSDTILNGRMFIKKNDKIYVRAYGTPDYVLEKDTSPKAGSIQAADCIKWLTTSKLRLDDTLTIKYNYDYLINTLQTGMESKRCLTADVLIKQAEKVPVEIIVDIYCYPYVTISDLKTTLTDDLVNWLDNLQKLGGYFDESDIVAIIKQRDEVDSVPLNTVKISIKGYSPQTKISCADNQYLKVENIILNVYYNDKIIM